MFKLLISSIVDLKNNIRQYILFGLLALFTTSFIFIPIISFIFQRMILLYNSGIIMNQDIFKIFLDKDNLLSLFAILLLAVTFIFMEMAIYILIAHKNIVKKDIYITEAFFTALKKLPRLLTIELFYFLILFIVLLPLIELPVQTSLTQTLEVPEFYQVKVEENPIYSGLYALLFVGLLYIMYRFIFTLHGVILKKEKISRAMKKSFHLTKVGSSMTIVKLIFINLFYIGFGIFLLFLVSKLQTEIRYTPPLALRKYLVTLSGLFFNFYTMLLTPFNMIFLTRLYYDLDEKQGDHIDDQVTLVAIKKIKNIEVYACHHIRKKKVTLLLVLVLTLSFSLYTTLSKQGGYVNHGRNVDIIAHRGGYTSAAENSLMAIDQALEKGVTIIELDVQLTKDGIPVLHHDYSLSRMTGLSKQVSDVTYLTLQNTLLKNGHGQSIPSLKSALDRIDKAAYILIDIKSDHNTKALVDAIIEDLKATDMMAHAYIQSFDQKLLTYVRSEAPLIGIGQVMYFFWGELDALDVDFYTVHYTMLSRNLVKEIKKDDKQLWVWTIDDPEILGEVLKFDINGLITSDIDMVQETLGLKDKSLLEEDENTLENTD